MLPVSGQQVSSHFQGLCRKQNFGMCSSLREEAPAQMLLFMITTQDTWAPSLTETPSATIRVYQNGSVVPLKGVLVDDPRGSLCRCV